MEQGSSLISIADVAGFDSLGRPSWNLYFMNLALQVSQRSMDPATKHGAVVVDDDKNVLCLGYNGPPRNCVDTKIPLTRPEKYYWFVHAEEAAIGNAARIGVSLRGSTFYVSGMPCEKCMRLIINVGAKRVIYGPVGSHCVSGETKRVIRDMLDAQKPDNRIDVVDLSNIETTQNIQLLMKNVNSYLLSKTQIN